MNKGIKFIEENIGFEPIIDQFADSYYECHHDHFEGRLIMLIYESEKSLDMVGIDISFNALSGWLPVKDNPSIKSGYEFILIRVELMNLDTFWGILKGQIDNLDGLLFTIEDRLEIENGEEITVTSRSYQEIDFNQNPESHVNN